MVSSRILLVDDSELFRRGLRDRIEAAANDWEICGQASDGFEALEKTRLLNPNLIIMDFSMPRMTGTEAARQILNEFPNIPILLLTMHFTGQLVEEATSVGIRKVLSKIDMHDFENCIHALFRGDLFTATPR